MKRLLGFLLITCLLLSFALILPAGSVALSSATWTSQADFENNASTTGSATSQNNLDAVTNSGNIKLDVKFESPWQTIPLLGRDGHTAVWTGTKMIVWGGYGNSGNYLNDGGIYDPSNNSWKAISTNGAPSARSYHTAVWTGSKMIIWGGWGDSDNAPTDNAIYNPSTDTWEPISTIGAPQGRNSHTAIWTGNTGNPATSNKMIVWGGSGDSEYLNDGGIYDPSTDTWQAISTDNAPFARGRHTAIWTGSKMIVWGGWANGGSRNDGGIYDPLTDSWQSISTTGSPSERLGHTAVWTGSKMIIWGGYGYGYGGIRFNDGGIYDPSNNSWQTISTTGAPSARGWQTATWTGSKMIVWGGNNGSVNLNDGSIYDLSTDTWQPISTTGAPIARNSHTAIWTGSKMIIWGGYAVPYQYGSSIRSSNGGIYDPSSDNWSTTGAPLERSWHTAVWTGSKMIIWGGSGYGGIRFNDGGIYDPSNNSWQTISTTGAPSARGWQTATWTGSKMIVWGGNNGSVNLNDGGIYDPSTNTWQPISTNGAPSARSYYTAVWTGSKMIIWGGYNNVDPYLNDGGIYDPSTDTWEAISTNGAPSSRYAHTAVWIGSEMIIWGGTGNSTDFNDGGIYNPSIDSWKVISTNGAPSGRSWHTAVWTGSKMVVWGGWGDDDGGIYNPSTDSWQTINDPFKRTGHTAVWTGSKMIIWGGDSFQGLLNDGGMIGNYPFSGIINNLKINAGNGNKANWSTISWNGETPANTSIKFRTRGAGTEAGLASAAWSDFYNISGSNISNANSQWLEVEATLESIDGVSSPTLNDLTVNYDIEPVLDPIGNKSVNEGSPLTFTLNATDADGGPLIYNAANLPSGAFFNPVTKEFSWTPSYNQAGTYPNIRFEVFDGSSTVFEDITITVNDVTLPSAPTVALNTSLKISAGPKTIKRGKAVIIKGQLKDSNGKPVAGKRVIIKANGKKIKTVKTNSGGKFRFRHKPKKTTKYTATYAGDNNYNKSSSKAVKVIVKKKATKE